MGQKPSTVVLGEYDYEGRDPYEDGDAQVDETEEELHSDDEAEDETTGIRTELLDIGKRKLAARSTEEKAKGKKAAAEYTVKNKYFRVKVTDIMDPVTGEVRTSVAQVTAIDYNLAGMLNGHQCVITGYEKVSGFLSTNQYPTYYGPSIVQRMQAFRASAYAGPWFDAFMPWLEEEYKVAVERIETLLKEGKIAYDGVWYLFENGNRFYADIGVGLVVGSEVTAATYVEAMCGRWFTITGEVIKSDGNQFYTTTENFRLDNFSGVIDVDRLAIKPMTHAMLNLLTERGRGFQHVALGHHFLHYERFMHIKHQFGFQYFKADGRVMVDIATFNRINEGYGQFEATSTPTEQAAYYETDDYDNYGESEQQTSTQQPVSSRLQISEKLLYKTWPTVAGFSFAAKAWGEIIITNLSPITFDDRAYDQLVLSEEKKNMIKALVEDNEALQKSPIPGFTDLITGKGGGVIFLLHGPPGSGKTLTAEAVAELLHRPLYSISVGELGTTAERLEQKLSLVLEVASIWNAVVLVDEADIFLERRREHDIVRNAMVGIFLRKLEYLQGVLFLTTNRVQVFDPAFNSRVSVGIKYHDLGEETRKIVWRNLLDAARARYVLDKPESARIQLYPINGRQIRTSIRLGLAIARNKAVELDPEMLITTIEFSSNFEKELELSEGAD